MLQKCVLVSAVSYRSEVHIPLRIKPPSEYLQITEPQEIWKLDHQKWQQAVSSKVWCLSVQFSAQAAQKPLQMFLPIKFPLPKCTKKCNAECPGKCAVCCFQCCPFADEDIRNEVVERTLNRAIQEVLPEWIDETLRTEFEGELMKLSATNGKIAISEDSATLRCVWLKDS